MIRYLSKEEIDAGIDAGDTSIINGLLSGEVKIGVEPVEEPEEEVVEEVFDEQPINKEALAEEPEDDGQTVEQPQVNIYEQELIAKREKIAELEKRARDAEEAKAKLESLRGDSAVSSSVNVNVDNFVEDEMEADLAGEYGKNTRTILSQVKNAVEGAASVDKVAELEAKINAMLELEESRHENERIKAAEKAESEKLSKVFSEVDSFKSRHEFFDFGKSTEQAYKETITLKEKIAAYLGTEDQNIIEKSFREVANNKNEELVKGLSRAGISIPDGLDKYMQVVEITDLKNGYRYNDTTNEYEQITDEFGNVIGQRNLEDAYKLSRFNDLIMEAKAEQAEEIAKRLSTREASARTIPDNLVADAGKVGMSLQEKTDILSMPSSAFINNPELMEKLNAILNNS